MDDIIYLQRSLDQINGTLMDIERNLRSLIYVQVMSFPIPEYERQKQNLITYERELEYKIKFANTMIKRLNEQIQV